MGPPVSSRPLTVVSPALDSRPLDATPLETDSPSAGSSGSATPLTGSLTPHPHSLTEPSSIPIGDIEINGVRKGVFVFFTNAAGERIPLPPGITIDLSRLKRCTQIFKELIDSANSEFRDKEVKSVSLGKFNFTDDTSSEGFYGIQLTIWTRFRTLLLEGTEQPDAELDGAFLSRGESSLARSTSPLSTAGSLHEPVTAEGFGRPDAPPSAEGYRRSRSTGLLGATSRRRDDRESGHSRTGTAISLLSDESGGEDGTTDELHRLVSLGGRSLSGEDSPTSNPGSRRSSFESFALSDSDSGSDGSTTVRSRKTRRS